MRLADRKRLAELGRETERLGCRARRLAERENSPKNNAKAEAVRDELEALAAAILNGDYR